MVNTIRQTHIALVEDDDTIRELIQLNLLSEKYKVDAFFSVEQLEKKFYPNYYDLIILDIMLPGKNGLSFAEKLHKEKIFIPILFISALGHKEKIKAAYEVGAIDYIVKPFEIDLLLYKIRNLLLFFSPRKHKETLPQTIGQSQVNWSLMEVKTPSGKKYKLTPKESAALHYFVQNKNRIVSRNELMETVWGEDVFISGRNVDNFLVKFRKLFEQDPGNPKLFITYPKKGYACILK